jgi:hypothetical protein
VLLGLRSPLKLNNYSSNAMQHPPFANVVYLVAWNGTDGATTDTELSSHARALTFNGNAQIDTAQSKFGGSSLLCDGTGDYVTTPDDTEFTLGTNEFTFDTHYRFNVTTGSQTFFGQWGGSSSATVRSWVFWYTSGTGIRLSRNNSGVSINFGWAPSAGVWYHLRFMRKVDTLYVYVDGVLLTSQSLGAALSIADSSSALAVGADSAGATGANGWFQETRLAVGWSASNTANFAPPTTTYSRS